MNRILLLGAGGLMGRYLHFRLQFSSFNFHSVRKSDLDITDRTKSAALLKDFSPDLVINAAALCRMEDCEANPVYSKAVNMEAPAWWAKTCHEQGARLIQLSTDYVFAGGRTMPYAETDEPEPLSVYARHKREAECSVLLFPDHIVLRLAWIFGMGGSTFMSRIPDLLMKEEQLRVATGRIGSCLYAGYGAEIIVSMLGMSSQGGLYHLTHGGELSWMNFAVECKRQMLEKGMPVKNREICAVPEGEHEALSAKRPNYSVLELQKIESLLGRALQPWEEGLELYLKEIVRPKAHSHS
jgi:dTDP-4-dehydrorhamnose reductase